ncbi:MAG: TolC family protein, partial [Bacteroidota bacterium]
MMKLSKAILLNILLFVFLIPSMEGQESKIMSFDSFMEIVEEHHPLSLQAELFPEQGRQGVKEARGGFDPKLVSDLANKNFDGKTYYDVFEGGMKIPTWFGLEFYGGFEQNQGVFLNPERTVPDGGLAHAGVSLPVGRGLFIDKRRASLRQAQIAQRSSLEERRELRNQLFYEAAKAYWDWFKAYHVLEVYRDAQRLAEVRLRAVQQGAELGDRAFIDTLEAEIQVQNRQLSAQEALLELENARALLELFLWRDGIIPLELTTGTIPVANEDVDARLPDQRFRQQIDSLAYLHPNLAQSRFKLEQLGIEQRLKREQLKPKLDLKYNFLTEPVGNNWLSNFNTNNYAWGFSFSVPLFLRKERAAINLNRLKM